MSEKIDTRGMSPFSKWWHTHSEKLIDDDWSCEEIAGAAVKAITAQLERDLAAMTQNWNDATAENRRLAGIEQDRDAYKDLLDAAQERERGLREALNIYGTHKSNCNVPMSECSCGFDTALTAQGKGE